VRFDMAVTHSPPVLESLLSRRPPSSLQGHNIQLRAIDGVCGNWTDGVHNRAVMDGNPTFREVAADCVLRQFVNTTQSGRI
jgi:hypothetical protein